METILDIIRGFRPADGGVLRIDSTAGEPFAAFDHRIGNLDINGYSGL